MSDVAPQQTAQAPSENTGAPTQDVSPKSDERYDKLEGMFNALQKQLNGISAATRAKAKEPEASGPTEQQALTLKSINERLDAKEAKIKSRAIASEIDVWVKSQNIDPTAAPFVKAFIREQYGTKLDLNDREEVIYTDELERKLPFAELGKQILASQGGQHLVPPTPTPGSVGQRGPTPGVANASHGNKPLSAWTAEDHAKNPALGEQLLREAYLRHQRGS